MLQVLIRESFKAPPPAPAATAACARCNGGGKFMGRNGRPLGDCYGCNGTGRVRLARPAAPAAGPVVSDEALRAAFDSAKASGLRRPRITLGDVVVKPAGASSSNPGALYVTEGETYLGKIIAGRFQRSGACTPVQADRIAELVSDPKAAIEAYGHETGICAICGLTLTNPESIERGIGPICAERWGF